MYFVNTKKNVPPRVIGWVYGFVALKSMLGFWEKITYVNQVVLSQRTFNQHANNNNK